MAHADRYIPALSHDWLTPLYDPLIGLFMREARSKGRLIAQARLLAGHRVLDLGCGTGTLAIMIKRAEPGAEVVGLDGDPQVLEIARAKATKAGVEVRLDRGMAFDLPYADGSFDRVVSSLVLHHLSTRAKRETFAEVARVLAPGGELHVVDFGPPRGLYGHFAARLMSRSEELAVNVEGRLPDLFGEAGLEDVVETGHFGTLFATLAYYRARKP
jgi:ubiquinone/menaquinone biosynthesis C-methylase UbiE